MKAIPHESLWHYLLGIFPVEGVALVFEDDVEIRPQMSARWQEICAELPADWDFTLFTPTDTPATSAAPPAGCRQPLIEVACAGKSGIVSSRVAALKTAVSGTSGSGCGCAWPGSRRGCRPILASSAV